MQDGVSPEYYLVYFLLVDLLGFKCYGRGEKVAWSTPVEIEGQHFLIEHRKLGLGVLLLADATVRVLLWKSYGWCVRSPNRAAVF